MRVPRCPKCNARVIQKSLDDGKIRIRTNVVAFSADGAAVVCKRCGEDVPLDLELGAELRKALGAEPEPRLVVRKGVDTAESPP